MKKYRYVAMIVAQGVKGPFLYGHVYVIAESEDQARLLVQQHLADKKPLGFSEREIRKKNPKRTPCLPGLKVSYLLESGEVSSNSVLGVVCD